MGNAPGEHFIEDTSERVDVGETTGLLAGQCLLRTHVKGRTDCKSFVGQVFVARCAKGTCDSEVRHYCHTAG